MMSTMLPSPPPTERREVYFTPIVSSPLSSSPMRASSTSPSSSPLTARHQNIPSRNAADAMDAAMKSPTPPGRWQQPQGTVPYSRRVAKFNPLIHGRDDLRETRRQLFLKRVRQTADEKRWEKRGGDEEMMRLVWVAEQRRRNQEKAVEASLVPAYLDDEEDIERRGYMPFDTEMVDEMAVQEDAEIEAYLNSLQDPIQPPEPHPYTESVFGSDDDYDDLFMDVIRDEEQISSQPTNQSFQDAMDTN